MPNHVIHPSPKIIDNTSAFRVVFEFGLVSVKARVDQYYLQLVERRQKMNCHPHAKSQFEKLPARFEKL